jgi:hypothetical protein
MQSYYVGVKGQPSANMKAEVNFNILGNVAGNPIDDIFYENVGRPIQVETPNGVTTITDNNRLRVYNAEFEWNAKDFDMRGFYRTGHYHWSYEGDFFNLYPEAYYGPNLDIYNGNWISGIDVVDEARLGSQQMLPWQSLLNKGRNTYYFLPLLLGLIDLFFQIKWDKILCNQEKGRDSHQEYYLNRWLWSGGQLINTKTNEETAPIITNRSFITRAI